MKSLFDDREQWTDEGRQLDEEIAKALGPIFMKWANSEYSLRDIHYVALQSVQDSGISTIIARS